MADGPRCKRRKQANPQRSNVTNYSAVVDAGSDSEDEGKLHIVEADGGQVDGTDCDSTLPEDEAHCSDEVKEDCGSDGEDDMSRDTLVEEMLQQRDTAVIYPEAPEDERQREASPDATFSDENGTPPDLFSQLLTCPYCTRGYKRYSSLKEHIRYRHEKTKETFSCPECSCSFPHRALLERHLAAHKSGRNQRHAMPAAGNRKFKCTECGKAFKYKHHLKEHLRIHSGEKPYECSNCKKRFSHSGSYSSHISSKKCIRVVSINGRPHFAGAEAQNRDASPSAPPSSAPRGRTREKLGYDKPLQREQLLANRIKTEPADDEYKPVALPTPAVSAGIFSVGAAAPLQGTVQAVVLPALGLVSPISINLADLHNALRAAVDGNVVRQALVGAGKNQTLTAGTLPQQLVSAISLPVVGQSVDGSAQIIINYSVDANRGRLAAHNLKKEAESGPQAPGTTDMFSLQKIPEDLTVGRPRETNEKEEKTTKTCLLCDSCPAGLETIPALDHCKAEGLGLNGRGLGKPESAAVASLLSEGGLCKQPKNLLSLLKACFALSAESSKGELSEIADSLSLPAHVVKKWLDTGREGQVSLGAPGSPSAGGEDAREAGSVVSPVPGRDAALVTPCVTQDSPPEGATAEVNGARSSPPSPVPVNLTASGGPVRGRPPQNAEGPLDLSLPKPLREETERALGMDPSHSLGPTNGDEPLNLTCTKKDGSALLVGLGAPREKSHPSAKPFESVAAMHCHRTLTTNGSNHHQTILIPQLAYTYTTTANSPAGTEMQEIIHLNGVKEERQDPEGLSAVEEQSDSDSGPQRKKTKKTDSGTYACDLCDKVFQKSSSLLRHKYEHTGRRPHECGICSKAFKHKHHLIEHMRLHSGEKPYECDKCGKRFSHSGSYSQHMNHRYSYCKKEAQGGGGGGGGGRQSPEEDLEVEMESQAGLPGRGPWQQPEGRDEEVEEAEEEEEEEGSEEDEEEEKEDVSGVQVVKIGDDREEEKEEEQEVALAGDGEVKEEEEDDAWQEEAPRSLQEGVKEEEEEGMDTAGEGATEGEGVAAETRSSSQ
ncbi:zinc finger E-box-binding homeobox 1b [Nelusetta ayraudi]|uniref:zinc finger E-box-binding homeobox 1b n=1 Tax=Nelusetta ayraudi TaxID=303726 RepID=UPI003F6FD087